MRSYLKTKSNPGSTLLLAVALLSPWSLVAQKGMPQGLPGCVRVAYVNVDSLEEHYVYLTQKKEQLSAIKERLENYLEHEYRSLQKEADSVQQLLKAGKLNDSDKIGVQQYLETKETTLRDDKQAYVQQLSHDEEDVNTYVRAQLDSFLTDYNKTRHYDCILSYTPGNTSILYIDKSLDITAEVIKGMNELAEKRNK
jgi:outer membrane protein